MKNFTNFIKKELFTILLLGILGLFSLNSNAQVPATGKDTILKQPCKGADGILVAKVTSGMTLPLTFYYYGYPSVTHSNVNSFTDTLKGVQMCWDVFIEDNFFNPYVF